MSSAPSKPGIAELFQNETLTVSRRDYLERMLEAALASTMIPILLPDKSFAATKSSTSGSTVQLQGGFLERPTDYQPELFLASERYSNRRAFRLNLTQNKFVEIESDVAIHSLEVHPKDSNLTISTSRFSDTASLIDWSKGREIKVLRLKNRQEFYGHGAFADDGRSFICSVARRKKNGWLADFALLKIDVESFKILETILFPYGSNHDLVACGANRFAIGGGTQGDITKGASTHLVIFDLTTGKFKKIDSPTLPKFEKGSIAIRHVLKKSPDTVLAALTRIEGAGQQEGGFIEFDLKTQTSKFMVGLDAKIFQGELLSFDIARDGRLWISLPESGKLIVWNPKNHCIDATIQHDVCVRSVRTIDDLDYVIVGTDKQFYAYDPITLRRLESIDSQWPSTNRSGRVCSHTRFVKT